MKRILLVEDDEQIAKLVSMHLRDIQGEVDWVKSGHEGLAKAKQGAYDLVILDIMLPGLDGLEVCKQLRHESKTLPIMLLTARAEEIDKILGLELGADDYVTKPFSIRELLARAKALMRRGEGDEKISTAGILVVGEMQIDRDRRHVTLAGKRIELTNNEFDLLLFLAEHPGRPFTRSALLDHIWGYNFVGYEHTVNTTINRLRGKLQDNGPNPKYIKTVWGVGYCFAEQEKVSV